MKYCIIPARAGSKRIPHKNTRMLNGRPLIAHAIEAARKADMFDRIIVSTDSEAIMDIARDHGAETPFTRPAELADDYATSVAVIRHAITAMAEIDGHQAELVGCIYPTAVFVTPVQLQAGLDLLEKDGLDCVFAAARYPAPIERALRQHPGGGVAMADPAAFTTRSQDLPEWYHDVGQFYLARPQHWFGDILFNDRAGFIAIPAWAVQDLDSEDDWQAMEIKLELLARHSPPIS